MSYDFTNAKKLLALCSEHNMKISEVMLERELELSGMSRSALFEMVDRCLRVMESSTNRSLDEEPVKSMGGLIGGESRQMRNEQGTGLK